MLDIADNSGVKSALCIKVLGRGGSRGKFTRPVAGVGDIVCVAIKKSLPTCQLDDKKVHKCVKPEDVAGILADDRNDCLSIERSDLFDPPAEPPAAKTNEPGAAEEDGGEGGSDSGEQPEAD